jgi:cytochrome P450
MGGWRWHNEIEQALLSIVEVMKSVAQENATAPADRVKGSVLQAFVTTNPAVLEDPSSSRNLALILRFSHGDLTGLMDWIFKMLSDNREWQSKVCASGRTTGSVEVAQPTDTGSRIVLETLRLEQSEYLYRRVGRSINIDGYVIPAGWLLRVCVQESHRDPKVFPSPERFDPDRFLGRTFDRSEYSPFGADEHGCMGARLAIFLGRVFVEELCLGYEWTVTREGPLEHGSRHRHHWRPSADSRVVMRPAKRSETVC